MILLIVWAVVWYIPIPPAMFAPTSKRRLFILGIGLLLFGFNVLANTPLAVFVYFLIFSRTFVALLEYFLSVNPFRYEQLEKSVRSRRFSPIQITVNQRRGLLGVALIAIFLLSVLGIVVFGEAQRVTNASYFNSLVQQTSGLPFTGMVPDGKVRLVTQELAISIARRHMSEFGSNTQILDCHVTKSPEGRLVWVATIGSTNVIAENYIKGFVIVDANEPSLAPTIVNADFKVGEGLWWDRNIPFRNYVEDISNSYGVAYLTWNLDTTEPVYVITRFNVGFDLVRRYEPPFAYDSEGQLKNAPLNRADIPDWMTQVYDEDWLEGMMHEMGTFRRGNSFDYFAGGFLWIVGPSTDRFEITEDTRYVIDPGTNEVAALVCVNPIENQRTLSGVFKATREGISFYDFKNLNYISGLSAQDLVEGRLPKPATGNYYAVMPLLYGIEVTPGNFRLAWYVPIYWYEESYDGNDETIYLAGFAIVDAQDTSKIVSLINQEGINSEEMVRQTRLEYAKLFGGNQTGSVQLAANVLNSYSYVQDGLTHIVLHVDNATYPWIEATPNELPADEWNQLLSTQQGQVVIASIEKREDRWMVTQFSVQTSP